MQQAGRGARCAPAQPSAIAERDRYGRACAGSGQQVPREGCAGKPSANNGKAPARAWRRPIILFGEELLPR